ncbi:MAG TPA: cellulase family glycosylhydrolase [Mycobacterium sp.]|nr:cellulase family glycosylhydrolase [Mycobacterium sp.]
MTGGLRPAATVLTLLCSALAAAPSARADVVDDVIDQALSPSADAATSALAEGDAGYAFTADLIAWTQQYIYNPMHTEIENWIGSDLGAQVDAVINKLAGSDVIGNGTAGTAAHPDGGAGGSLFGDGGAGWNSTEAGVAGGNGGAAGVFGTGGAGGEGGAGAAGGAGGTGGSWMGIGGAGGTGGEGAPGAAGGSGGDGGSATGMFGIGGDGGAGGDSGAGSTALPALGGAGGVGGQLGLHGTVGDYGTPIDAAPSTGAGGLSTTGDWFTNGASQVVVMHGLYEVNKVAPFEPSATGFGASDAAFLADNGFNAVTLGIIWSAIEPEPGVFNDAYLASIAQTVQTLASHGIHVFLSMHQDLYGGVFGGEGAPEWATQTGGLPNPHGGNFIVANLLNPAQDHAWDAFWSNADGPNGVGLENSYAQMWEHVANYFGSDPGLKNDIAGYLMMTEPSPGSLSLQTLFGSPTFESQDVTPFYNQVASAIRAVDPNTPVLAQPEIFFDVGVPTHLGTVDQPNTVFSFDNFCPTTALDATSSAFCGAFDDLTMGNAANYASAHGIPAFLTSFGSTSNLTTIADAMQAADQHRFGWTEWAYTGQNDITSTDPTGEALVINPGQPLAGDNVDAAKLATLAAPYPQLVSGTPNSWSFDNGTFQFSYSTEMASGSGVFPAGSQTTVSVPAVEYPNGYQVAVTGGHVVSAPNAPELVIASNGGAATVTVTVSAAAGAAHG